MAGELKCHPLEQEFALLTETGGRAAAYGRGNSSLEESAAASNTITDLLSAKFARIRPTPS